ncbi:2-oxo acid dehydrogenase subunit E2, partial [Staphylococcus saprophyticus]|uniref:2-oxo acid dehydrogenase subunit E2 n=1 Tax=Staphylococcus saprophyticus TaxID=29385 RepID=UPI0037038A3B
MPTHTHTRLLLPLLKNPHPKSIFPISHQINQLPLKPRDAKLSPHQIKPPTSTITNIRSPARQCFTPV